MNRIGQTRFKLVVSLCIAFFIQGIIKVLLPQFPLVEVMGAQGAVAGGYLGFKTADNIKEKRYANNGGIRD